MQNVDLGSILAKYNKRQGVTMKQLTSIVAATVLSLGISQAVYADHHEGKYQKKCPCIQKVDKMAKKLDLTKEQQDKISAIRNKAREATKADWKQLKALRVKMHDLVKSDTIDQEKMKALIDERKDISGRMSEVRLQMKHDIYQVLTPEQRGKFEVMMQEWRKKMDV